MLFLCIYIRNGFGFIIYDLSVILHKSEIINLKDMKIRAIIVLALIACGIVSTIFYVKANQASTNEKAITEAIQTKNNNCSYLHIFQIYDFRFMIYEVWLINHTS